MTELQFPNIVGSFLQGQELGRQRAAQDRAQAQQTRLGELAQLAYDAAPQERSQFVGEAIGINPEAGLALDKQFSAQDQARESRLLSTARLIAAAPEEQKGAIFAQVRPQIAEYLPGLPDTYTPQVGQGINAFIASRTAGGEQFTLSPGSARYGSGGQLLVQQPFAPEKPDFVLSPDGTQWLPKPTGASTFAITGGAMPSPSQDFATLGSEFNIRPTSVNRTPERNAEVGGVPNSFHLTGQASDWVVPQEQKAAFRQRAQSLGYQVLDEGDHIHIEPRSRQAPTQGGAIPIPGAIARPEPEETFSQPQVVTNPATGKQELVQFGNRGGRRVVSDYTPGPTDRDAKPPTEGERKAATLLSRLEFSENQLRQAVQDEAGAASPSVLSSVAGAIPFVGEQARNLANSPARQRVEAAQLDILDAALTLGTGAAYTREQLEGYRRSYFPQIGDSQATIDDKAARLQNVIDSARIAAGRAGPQGDQSAGPPTITTQAQFDALPSGAVFIEDGQQYRKP